MLAARTKAASVQRITTRAMGTGVDIEVVDGDPEVGHDIQVRLDQIEARWSRFRPDSEISRLNRASGRPMVVSADTITLVEHAVAAARATQGLYDPGIGRALARFGYDRTFDDVPLAAASRTPRPFVDGTWPAIQIDHGASTITLPAGMVFDAGGIGKGLAADLVTTEHQDRAAGILVNLGGDMRMVGAAAEPEGWIIAVEDPRDLEHEALRLTIPDGAVATSSRLKRCWTTAVGPAHHVIDPRTGRPAVTPVTAVTVVAAEAWWAETQATALFLQGPTALADVHDVEAAIWTEDGSTYATPALKELLR